MTRIGLISDTHGLLRPQALALLQGCNHIVHAGDIGRQEILDALAAVAPLTAVRGNNDHGPWAEALPEAVTVHIAGLRVHVLHDLAQLPKQDAPAGVQVVVSGHSHRPRIEERAGVLFVNPGSAGPRRFRLPVSVAHLVVDGRGLPSARLLEVPLP